MTIGGNKSLSSTGLLFVCFVFVLCVAEDKQPQGSAKAEDKQPQGSANAADKRTSGSAKGIPLVREFTNE